jgi:hypothetical protein
VDTVDNFHGLERLIAIALCLDKVGSPEAIMQSRARLYCAVTRAQFFVVVVNEFLRGGCTEFLGHVELRENQDTVDMGEVNRKAATALIDQKKEQRQGVTPAAAAAEQKTVTKQTAATKQKTAGPAKVNLPRPP